MGSNMQKQAVPLLTTEAPIVGTGMEYKAAMDSGVLVIAKNSGVVEKVDSDRIVISQGDRKDVYELIGSSAQIRAPASTSGPCRQGRLCRQAGDSRRPRDGRGRVALSRTFW